MKKILQLLLLAISVLISSTSCSSYPYTEDDDTLGFGPVSESLLLEQGKFKTDDRYDIHNEYAYDEEKERDY
ncbi:MAG: hypothetical protein NE327_05045 [Lentisphaeraceae bacterium]|nr:hypothetical protein [Lentisphaeraceae bacterium]